MNIFEYAMQMETDGRNFYLEHVAKAPQPELKKILTELADDELKHYNLFKALRDGHKAEYKEETQTTILVTVKNVFQQLRSSDKTYAFAADAKKIWEQAREVERKSESFYREQANIVDRPDQKKILTKVADEEHKHWVTLQNVIEFLDRPSQWLENAEWNSIEE